MDNQKPTPDHLQQSLSQLHAVLVRTPHVDASSKQLLRDVLGDIERLLSNGAVTAAPAQAAQSQSRLEALAVEFEAEHPSLSASLREFVDLLGRAGM
jgi:Domain of unknown function (DUF4404)